MDIAVSRSMVLLPLPIGPISIKEPAFSSSSTCLASPWSPKLPYSGFTQGPFAGQATSHVHGDAAQPAAADREAGLVRRALDVHGPLLLPLEPGHDRTQDRPWQFATQWLAP